MYVCIYLGLIGLHNAWSWTWDDHLICVMSVGGGEHTARVVPFHESFGYALPYAIFGVIWCDWRWPSVFVLAARALALPNVVCHIRAFRRAALIAC